MRKYLIVGLVILGAILVLFGADLFRREPATIDDQVPEGSVEASEAEKRTLDTSGPVQLEFPNLRGSVTIKTGEPGTVVVTAIRRASGADDESARRELELVTSEITPSPGRLVLATKIDTGRWPFTRSAAGKHVDYQLVVQEGSGVIVTNGVGSVKINGLKEGVTVTGPKVDVSLTNVNGGIKVRVDLGQIRVDGGGGGLELSTRQGSISAGKVGGKALTVIGNENISLLDGEIVGDVKVSSQSGDIKILRIHGKSVTADVTKGSIDIEETTADGALTATTKEGGISLTRTNAETLEATTSSGPIDLSETQGAMDLSTNNGGVSLWRATPRSLRVSATDAVYFSGLFSPLGQHSIATSSGDIAVYVAKESSLKLDASSSDGVSVDPMITLKGGSSGDKHLQASINDGMAPLTLSTKKGSIRIQTGEPRFFPR